MERLLHTHYELQDIIGTSNFATTYLAFDRDRNEKCVVKCVPLKSADPSKAMELFKRDAEIFSRLNHRGIPKFLDCLSEESSRGLEVYLIQTYVDGKNCEQLVDKVKYFTEEEVVRIALDTSEILKYMQSFIPPVIHRDIKPSNLLLDPNNEVHLIDFGAVRDKILQDSLWQPEGPTVVGTYGYVPVEQFEGHAMPASDIYSLGATLIFLLSGKPPWEMDKDALSIDFAPHVHVSNGLMRILKKMIEPDWTKRYKNANALEGDLQKLLHPRKAFWKWR